MNKHCGPTFNFWFSCDDSHTNLANNSDNDKKIRIPNIGAFHFSKINASISSITIPYGDLKIETGPIKIKRAESSQLGTIPYSLINLDTGIILVNWPVSASFDLLEQANMPPLAFTFTGVGKMDLRSGQTLFFDTAEFEIPSFTNLDGTVLPARKCRGGNVNITKIVVEVPPGGGIPGIPLPSTGSFEPLNLTSINNFPLERMARQAFLLADIRVTESFIGKLVKEYRKNPKEELRFYFPDENKFVSSNLDGNFEIEFFDPPEVLAGNQENCE